MSLMHEIEQRAYKIWEDTGYYGPFRASLSPETDAVLQDELLQLTQAESWPPRVVLLRVGAGEVYLEVNSSQGDSLVVTPTDRMRQELKSRLQEALDRAISNGALMTESENLELSRRANMEPSNPVTG